ncbi:oligosaccharide repeat unit polymerase [Photobacterium damselae]|uniref:oligosaccharide repeat unit polymerase n=1 Tax=Photobacterium damselae TaxID=38293 RepID=UPI0040679B29
MKKIDYFGVRSYTFWGFSFFFLLPSIVVDFDYIAFTIGLVGLFSFYIGMLTKKELHFSYIRFPAKIEILAIFILIYKSYLVFSFLLSSVNVTSYTEKYLNVNYFLIYFQILNILFDFFSYYILASYVGKSKKRYILVALLSILSNLSSDTRLDLIIPFIFWVGYGYYVNIVKVTVLRVLTVFAIMPVMFTFLLLKRVMKGEYSSYFEQIKYIYEYLDFDILMKNIYISMETFRSYEVYVKIVQDNFIHIESGFLRIFFMIIPRSLWIDKPESVSRIISHNYFPEQYYGGGGTVANIFGDAYINGGIIGVIIILFIWGYISKVIYNSTITKLSSVDLNTKSFLIAFYLLYICQSIQYFRGFMSESFWKLLYLILITLFLSKIFRSRHV